jgi:hypothetical protein
MAGMGVGYQEQREVKDMAGMGVGVLVGGVEK